MPARIACELRHLLDVVYRERALACATGSGRKKAFAPRAMHSRGHMTTAVLFPVSVENKTGYIDAKGRVRIQPQFDLAASFSEGLAFFANWDAKRQGDPVSRMWKGKYG